MIFKYILMYFDSVIALCALCASLFLCFLFFVSFWRKAINFAEMYCLCTVFDNSSHICPTVFCFQIELFS